MTAGGRALGKGLLLAAAAAVAALLVLEGLARVWLALTPTAVPVRNAAEGVIETAWFGHLRSGLVTDGAVPDLYVPDARLFWRLRPGLQALVENAVYQTRGEPLRWGLRISADGTRGEGYPSEGSPARPVILALGDSCTFGFRVNDDETYPAQLQRLLRAAGRPGATVINAGVPGYSSFQGLRLLRETLDRHDPDVVLLAFGANDLETDRLSDAEKARRLSPLRLRLALELRRLAIVRVLLGTAAGSRTPPGSGAASAVRVSPEEYVANMRAMVHAARERGAAVVLVDLVFAGTSLREALAGVARETGAPLVDGREVLSRGLEDLLAGRRFTAERSVIDRFWDERVEGYRMLDYDEGFYRRLFADPRWNALLRYLLVEPVHPSPLGHRLIAEGVARLIEVPGVGQETPARR